MAGQQKVIEFCEGQAAVGTDGRQFDSQARFVRRLLGRHIGGGRRRPFLVGLLGLNLPRSQGCKCQKAGKLCFHCPYGSARGALEASFWHPR